MKHRITADAARDLVKRGRQPRSWHFESVIFDALLAQEGATGLRIYMGRTKDGSETPVVVATDANGVDLNGVIAEEATPCPPFCAPESFLG